MIPIGRGRRKFPTREIYINVCFVLVQDFETRDTKYWKTKRDKRYGDTCDWSQTDSYMCSAAVAIPGEIMSVWSWRNGGVIPNQWYIDQHTKWISLYVVSTLCPGQYGTRPIYQGQNEDLPFQYSINSSSPLLNRCFLWNITRLRIISEWVTRSPIDLC